MKELDALKTIASQLSKLSTEEQERCINWINSKYSNNGGSHVDSNPKILTNSTEKQVLDAMQNLTATRQRKDLKAREINQELKNQGIKVSNITTVLKRLTELNPAPIIISSQHKPGSRTQKLYRLTEVGKDG